MKILKPFTHLPDDKRADIRNIVEAYKGECKGYESGYLTVAMPIDYDKERRMIRVLKTYGMDFVTSCLFPLITDKPAAHLRHNGYWKFVKFGYFTN